MSWNHRYQRRRFLRSSLYMVPIVCMVLALFTAPLIRWFDDQTQWTLMGFGPVGAKAILAAQSSSLLTIIVFSFSIILVGVQIASGQLTPRIIARVFESQLTKVTLGGFMFSYTYSLAALGRVEERVPQLPVMVAILLSLVSIALFLYLVQRLSQNLRPVSILTDVADDTQAVIDAIYSRSYSPRDEARAGLRLDTTQSKRIIHFNGRARTLRAFDETGLVAIATRTVCAIELVPQAGDFLATGGELFRIYGDRAATVDEMDLLRCVVLGRERALDQDPAFGFRIIVDIASKALSPAINDPTTCVLAIDQLQNLLHFLGKRKLDPGWVTDGSGEVRLVYRTPDWADFVTLAATEIRLLGGRSPQVTRRLKAMLEHLVRVLPEPRTGVLREEMALLQRTIDGQYTDPADRALAAISDAQGFGSRQ